MYDTAPDNSLKEASLFHSLHGLNMQHHKISVLDPQTPTGGIRKESMNNGIKKHKFTIFDPPLILLRILNWIIIKNGTGAKGKF